MVTPLNQERLLGGGISPRNFEIAITLYNALISWPWGTSKFMNDHHGQFETLFGLIAYVVNGHMYASIFIKKN